jgi:microcystin-dependent protein
VLVVQGTNSGIYQVIAPLNQPKMYVISNQTTGGYAITIGASSGSVVSIPNGTTAQVYTDGTNFYSAQTGSAGDFKVNGNFTVTGNQTDTGNLTVSGNFTANNAATFAVSPTAPTPTTGDNTTKLATTQFVQTIALGLAFTGSILMWPTASAPSGYLLCDGTAVSRTTYATLFALFGTTFGTGDGSTTFNLPNYTNRMPYGTTVGATGGSSTTTISQANIPNYNLTVNDSGHSHTTTFHQTSKSNNATPYILSNPYIGENLNGSVDLPTSTATTGISVNSGGSGTAMTTISPYLGINFIIKT